MVWVWVKVDRIYISASGIYQNRFLYIDHTKRNYLKLNRLNMNKFYDVSLDTNIIHSFWAGGGRWLRAGVRMGPSQITPPSQAY